MLDPSKEKLDEIKQQYPDGETCDCDVTNYSQLQKVATLVKSRWKTLDGLICCAGTQGAIGKAMENDPEEWSRTVKTNLDGTFYSIHAFDKLQSAFSNKKIICFSGGGATSSRPNFSAYAVSKTGVVRLVETFAAEWVDNAVDINAIAPGAIHTGMTEEVLSLGASIVGNKEYESSKKLINQQKESLERVLNLVNFLLSQKSDGITGRLISAVWDPWPTLAEHTEDLKGSDIYTLRRIIPEERGKAWE